MSLERDLYRKFISEAEEPEDKIDYDVDAHEQYIQKIMSAEGYKDIKEVVEKYGYTLPRMVYREPNGSIEGLHLDGDSSENKPDVYFDNDKRNFVFTCKSIQGSDLVLEDFIEKCQKAIDMTREISVEYLNSLYTVERN